MNIRGFLENPRRMIVELSWSETQDLLNCCVTEAADLSRTAKRQKDPDMMHHAAAILDLGNLLDESWVHHRWETPAE